MCFYCRRIEGSAEKIAPSGDPVWARRLTDLYPSGYTKCELLMRHRGPYGVAGNRDLKVVYYGQEPAPFPNCGASLKLFGVAAANTRP